jgi:hypothetical protein
MRMCETRDGTRCCHGAAEHRNRPAPPPMHVQNVAPHRAHVEWGGGVGSVISHDSRPIITVSHSAKLFTAPPPRCRVGAASTAIARSPLYPLFGRTRLYGSWRDHCQVNFSSRPNFGPVVLRGFQDPPKPLQFMLFFFPPIHYSGVFYTRYWRVYLPTKALSVMA